MHKASDGIVAQEAVKYDVNNAKQQFAGKDVKMNRVSRRIADYFVNKCKKCPRAYYYMTDFSGKPQFI